MQGRISIAHRRHRRLDARGKARSGIAVHSEGPRAAPDLAAHQTHTPWVLYGFNVAFEAFGASIKLVFRIVEFSKIQELSVHTSLSCCPRRARRGESRARRALRGAVHTFVKGRCARFEVFF